jgi:uncharacterized protein DUF6600
MARRLWPALLLAGAVAWGGCAATLEQIAGYGAGYSEDPYEDLAPYGSWVDVAPYGSVWCPEVSSAWEPYTVGYWVYTDDGWFWVSEDPWGSLPYHYGRWAFDTDYGWVWVPGDEWASAWVAWRYGAGWVGWAPLPPDVSWQPQVGLDLAGYDLDSHIDRWYFTKAQDFGTSRVRVHVLPADSKQPIVKRTRDVTRYEPGPRPVEVGMRPDLIQRIGDTKIERYQIVDSSKPGPKNGVTIRGTQAEVYRPHVDLKSVVRERADVVQVEKHPSVAPTEEHPKIAPASIERDRVDKPEGRVVAGEPIAQQRPEVKKPDQREPVRELRPPPPPPQQPKDRARDESEKSQSSSVDEGRGQNVTKGEEAVPNREEARKSEDATPQRDEGDVPNREREIRGSDDSETKGNAQKSEVRERDDNARERERAVPESKEPPQERTRVR